MNRPDEIAALADAKASLADHVASFWKLLETETVHLAVNIRMEIGHEAPDGPTVYYDCTTFSDEVAKELVRLSATSPGDAVREACKQIALDYEHVGNLLVLDKAAGKAIAARIEALDIATLAPAEKVPPIGVQAGFISLVKDAIDLLAERQYGNPARSPGHNARLTLESALSLYAITPTKSATPTPPSGDVERCPDGVNPEAYAKASPEHKAWIRNEIPMNDKLFDEIMGIQSAAHGGGTDATWYRSGPVFGTYERITPSDPAQEPQAVAWRWQEPGWGDHWVYNPDPLWLEQQNDIIKQPLYTRPVSLYREALLDRVVEFDECETPEPTLRKMILGYYMQGLQPDAELARKFADRFILALIEGRT